MSDWTTDAANAIDNAVGLVRERTVEPVQAIVARAHLRLLAALDRPPGGDADRHRRLPVRSRSRPTVDVWIPWTVLGGIFVIAGWFCWIKRNP